jgi:Tfp pilus assembly protein PilX
MNTKHNHSSGQVIVIVLLTMTIVFTITLGIFLNSLSDAKMTKVQENSERAFDAAQAGIEQIISTAAPTDGPAATFVSERQ